VTDVKARAVGAVSDALWRWNTALPAQPAAIPIGLREAIADAVVAATVPRRVESAEDIRRLGEAVRDGAGDYPMVLLVDALDRVWRVSAVLARHPGEQATVWMESAEVPAQWDVGLVGEDRVRATRHGPWTVVWSRGVAEW